MTHFKNIEAITMRSLDPTCHNSIDSILDYIMQAATK